MDIQRAIRWVKQHAATDKCEASDDVLAALQEQAERKKGCEYCNGNRERIVEAFGGGWMEIINARGHFAIEAEDNDSTTSLIFNILYCPKCGRRLKKCECI